MVGEVLMDLFLAQHMEARIADIPGSEAHATPPSLLPVVAKRGSPHLGLPQMRSMKSSAAMSGCPDGIGARLLATKACLQLTPLLLLRGDSTRYSY
jgi:hypothetical protein